MLFRDKIMESIRQGRVKLAYRRWKRPTVKAGGTLLTAIGLLHIDAVDAVPLSDITEASAKASGFVTRAALLAELDKHPGILYRIRFHYGGEDPRIALRENDEIGKEEMEKILKKLEGLDERSPYGPGSNGPWALSGNARPKGLEIWRKPCASKKTGLNPVSAN